MKKLLATMAVAAVMAPASAFAVDVPFNGTVADTCTLNVTQNGVLTPAVDALSFSTTTDGVVSVVTNTGGFGVSVTASGTTWNNYGGTGTVPSTTFTTAMDVDGQTGVTSHTLTAAGSYTANVELSASATTPFPPGTYTKNVVFTCS
ncbi:MAG: hypothetical protein AAFO77_05940 [Pseudomonadota bacterium]